MRNLKKLLIVPFTLMMLSNISQASMLDQVIYNVVGQASNAAGARLGDEIYYGSSRSSSKPKKHRHKKRAPAKRNYAPKVTDAMRVQKALASLGFYRGRIDGQVNSFETRSAIKKMNVAYGISNSASLKSEAKDTLIFLGTLFDFDRQLISTNNNKRAKNRKIQVGLKLHGYYQGNIDGAIGERTRRSIAEYKNNNGMRYTGTLDFEEEYQLVSTAKEINDKNIEDSIASLEAMGKPTQQYATVANTGNAGQMYKRAQHQTTVTQQPQVVSSSQPLNPQQAEVLNVQTQVPMETVQQRTVAPTVITNNPQTLAQ